ncbi:MAG: hypothetical protein OXF01_12100 [Gemmatimonadetes bacterium]|nr:hypothetical protein [Gemmatimonadota bacterium]
MTDLPTRLTPSQVSRVLQQAAEIDARGDSLTVDELRRIADEAGIDPEATNRALQLVLADEDPDPKPAPATSPGVPVRRAPSLSPARMATGGAIGIALGFLGAFAVYPGPVSPGFPALGILTGLGLVGTVVFLVARTLDCMRRRAQLDFQLQNFTLWFGTAVGAMVTDLFTFSDDAIGAVFTVWVITSVVGGLFVRFGPRDEEGDP